MAQAQLTPSQQVAKAQQANGYARNLILHQGVKMLQNIYSNTFNPTAGVVLNIPPRNVGLILGWIIEIDATISNTATAETDFTPTPFGLANLIQQVGLFDLNNFQRILTSGWHLNFVNSAKSRRPFGSAFALAQNGGTVPFPIGYGDNWNVITGAATIDEGTSSTVHMKYWLPAAYGPSDLRGAIFANVVNATMLIQLTLATSAQALIASGDPTLAVYTGSTGTITSYTVNVYQHYIDQLPVANGQVVLPQLDLSTAYMLNNTSLSGVVSGQDFAIPFANYRDFMSAAIVYDNNGTLNVGSDINYLALQAANFVNITKNDPFIQALLARHVIHSDFPKGVYWFDFREKPISTIQYGNMELLVNPSSANNPTSVLVGFESLGMLNSITGAGSLPNT